MTNPLLTAADLPNYAAVQPQHVEPALDQALADNRAAIDRLLSAHAVYTWENLLRPLEELEDRLNKIWSPVNHLNSVQDSEALRAAYNACLPKLSAYYSELGQHQGLYRAYQQIADGPDYTQLDPAQRKIIDNALRDFRLSGIALPPEQQARYQEIMQELSQLNAKFSENVLDATQGWTRHLTDPAQLAGLPESALALARQSAQQRGLEGWLLTLELPSYLPVMNYADDRSLRKELYDAYCTRASEQGPNAGQWDNGPVMEQILALRYELAQLLGFHNYAEYSLATKMAESPQKVLEFLDDLARRAKPQAQRELAELGAFAREQFGINDLQAWDIGYYSEKLRQHCYQLSQEELRPYFPMTRVLPGLFAVAERLFDVVIHPLDGVETWHPDVQVYAIADALGHQRGRFYLDLYARSHKRGGAWMNGCLSRRLVNNAVRLPVAYLVCNFTPPVGNDPALLTHNEVLTMFHEFGHGLHHLLTTVNYLSVAGIHGVEWDAVELPSQFLENWCWSREALTRLAGHYQTDESLPESLYQRMQAARHFQAGMIMLRQLEFALFDFRLHHEYNPAQGGYVQALLDDVRRQVAVFIPPAYNRFANAFTHIFSGGYAAGYYSYKWAEVLSADAFSAFEENGIFDAATGVRFRDSILQVGGSRPALASFIEFRGREPQIEPLLRLSGITA
ncbi:MAG TPA: oligopeptidase A [Candidatus Competibacteraceae bacterium]|nr:oligopeptidase A [Candidatus Competibacter sp.]MDG4606915.1 oligopeptidase A [Candidatus Contendobacter sp.]HRD49363.1 oligopeptidase A [Candidatus Contendobacter sp.]HRF45426.1 oligopeptidase A [Candidatus Competibacteraceae bacterium]